MMMKSRSKQISPLTVLKYIGYGIGGALLIGLLGLLFGYVVMWLWNWLMPELFGLGEIAFWQAVGLVILTRLLFGGIKMGDHDKGHHSTKTWRDKCGDEKKRHWRHYDQFWKDEGKEAFEKYVRARENEEQE
jgi:hypothetical protein